MVKKKRQNDDDCDESTESCDESVKSSCPHVSKAVELTKVKKALLLEGFHAACAKCSQSADPGPENADFEVDLSLWMCLRCGSQLCGRSRNKHALCHYKTPRSDCHAITINTTSWNIYCYNCNNEISSSSTKKLQECFEFLKRQRSENVDEKIAESSEPIDTYYILPNSSNSIKSNSIANLPRVRGLSNLGNTCFFNSVMQCLVQTPYLLTVLKEMKESGEKFVLPGGKLKLVLPNNPGSSSNSSNGREPVEVDLAPIRGQLGPRGNLARVLAETLGELQSGESADVFRPQRLLSELVSKHPQFGGGDQHDAHELLRHLLEAVRTEDLRRYQTIILENLGLHTKVHPAKVEGDMKQKVKFYGNQASDTMLRPEQVFQGFLVSTLECQECFHTSDREEYFLDLSLPVAADRPQPPAVIRRKGAHEDGMFGSSGGQEEKMSKYQLKKEMQAQRKLARKNKGNRGSSNSKHSTDLNSATGPDPTKQENNKSSSEQSDADVEDNLEENPKPGPAQNHDTSPGLNSVPQTAANFAAYHMESGYNSEKVISSDSVRTSPVEMENKEKSDHTPERHNKDTSDIINSMIPIPLEYKPLFPTESISNPDSGVASPEVTKNNSSDAVNTVDSPVNGKELDSQSSQSSEVNMDGPHRNSTDSLFRQLSTLMNNCEGTAPDSLVYGPPNRPESDLNQFNSLKIANDPLPRPLPPPTTNLSYDSNDNLFGYRSANASPRYQSTEGECSIQSCLNQFTALELMTGNNKVGCENCTKMLNGDNGKTVYTNATKRFLVSSPPAVLILHLKRFQIGPRCMFRKIIKPVTFPTVLDLAPFCSEKVRNHPTVRLGQTKLLYSLYGVVEHSGGMHGGHYVAYVKVRPPLKSDDKKWGFVLRTANLKMETNGNACEEDNLSGYESSDGAVGGRSPTSEVDSPPGKWYYISDSQVHEVSEDKVLRKQAYLLFYERIL